MQTQDRLGAWRLVQQRGAVLLLLLLLLLMLLMLMQLTLLCVLVVLLLLTLHVLLTQAPAHIPYSTLNHAIFQHESHHVL
jgi:4-hydroxybenzoate polyprenyltransferase